MPDIAARKQGMERPGDGWLECIGLSLRRDEFPRLFEEIGTTYGAVDTEHFNLPSEPYTYIYAGTAAEAIPETPPAEPVGVGALAPAAQEALMAARAKARDELLRERNAPRDTSRAAPEPARSEATRTEAARTATARPHEAPRLTPSAPPAGPTHREKAK